MNFSDIIIVATDADGVLTDGKLFLDKNGNQGKSFSIKDGFAFKLLKLAGLKSVIISGKKTGIIQERFSEIGVDFIFENVENKLSVMERLCIQEGVMMKNVCYLGDDVPDIPVLKKVGFSVAPCDAVEEVKEVVMYVTGKKAGEGALRECAEIILKGQKKWEESLTKSLELL